MSVALLGTPTLLGIAGGSGSQGIAIDSGADGIFVGVVGFDFAGTANIFSGSPPTFDGVTMTDVDSGGDGNNSFMEGGVFFLPITVSGTKTLAWSWLGTWTSPTYGVKFIVGFVSGSDPVTPISGTSGAQQAGSPHESSGVIGVTGGLGIHYAWAYTGSSGSPTITWSGAGVTKVIDNLGTGSGGSDGVESVSISLAKSNNVGFYSPSSAWSASTDGGAISFVIDPAPESLVTKADWTHRPPGLRDLGIK